MNKEYSTFITEIEKETNQMLKWELISHILEWKFKFNMLQPPDTIKLINPEPLESAFQKDFRYPWSCIGYTAILSAITVRISALLIVTDKVRPQAQQSVDVHGFQYAEHGLQGASSQPNNPVALPVQARIPSDKKCRVSWTVSISNILNKCHYQKRPVYW